MRYYYNLFTRETHNVYAVFGRLKKPKVERDLQEKGKNMETEGGWWTILL